MREILNTFLPTQIFPIFIFDDMLDFDRDFVDFEHCKRSASEELKLNFDFHETQGTIFPSSDIFMDL